MRWDELADLFRGKSGIFVMDVGSREKADVLRETFLLSEVSLINKAAMPIHFAG